VPPRQRAHIFQLTKDHRARTAPQEVLSTSQDVEFGAFDVELDEVYMSDAVAREPLIQSGNANADGLGWAQNVRRSETVASRLAPLDDEEIGEGFLTSEGKSMDGNIVGIIQGQVQAQSASFARRRLKGEDAAGRTNAFRGKESVEALMSANIEYSHAGPQEFFDKGEFGRLERANKKRFG
jgi:hypothetical protein